jgi:hypothetical protein
MLLAVAVVFAALLPLIVSLLVLVLFTGAWSSRLLLFETTLLLLRMLRVLGLLLSVSVFTSHFGLPFCSVCSNRKNAEYLAPVP